jgi:hypothetical protein
MASIGGSRVIVFHRLLYSSFVQGNNDEHKLFWSRFPQRLARTARRRLPLGIMRSSARQNPTEKLACSGRYSA